MATDLEITKEQRHTAYSVIHHLKACEASIKDLSILMASRPKANKLTQKVAESVLTTFQVAMETVTAEHERLNNEVIEALKK